jgi:hypothetical protein
MQGIRRRRTTTRDKRRYRNIKGDKDPQSGYTIGLYLPKE